MSKIVQLFRAHFFYSKTQQNVFDVHLVHFLLPNFKITIIIFMYLLTPLTVQTYKKILCMDQELQRQIVFRTKLAQGIVLECIGQY